MNSSSVPASALNPIAAARSTCACSTCRGDCTTGVPSIQNRSHCTIAVDGSHGAGRIVDMSGRSWKSP
jgi:hypothetical protein